MAKENLYKTRILFPIGAKLVVIISIILLLSLGAVTILVSVLSTQDVQRTAEDNNFTVNRRAGSQTESSFKSAQAAVLLYLEMLDRNVGISDRDPRLDSYFFSHNQDLAALVVFAETGERTFIYNEQFFLSTDVDPALVDAYFTAHAGVLGSSGSDIRLFNASPNFQFPLTAMVFARQGPRGKETTAVLFALEELSETFGTGANTSFLIDLEGGVLLHPDNDLVVGGGNVSALPIVSVMQQEGDNNRQISFAAADGVKYFGAYYRLPLMNAAVITTIPHGVVFEAVQSITRQNIFLTVGVLLIAVLFIWFFSKTISSPVQALTGAALQIEQGEFEIALTPKTHDELGLLTESFGKMSTALGIFGRFTNRDIALRAMRGDIKPGGLPKHATVFFSDIRGFTEKSENFTKTFGEDASNRIVMWLNAYFTRMVDCVEKTGGVVDKFIGDAVMAHWGTAFTAGSPEKDALNCVTAALMMRSALIEINAQRTKNDPGNPEIRIGCGINTGIVTAGQIGSEQRMEYTVIGDPVNLASRTEALNKPLGTDILITEDTWNLVGDSFITEEMPPVSVKGKEKPVRMFAVINLRDAAGPQTLSELRDLLGIPTPDISKVDTDAEEKKYKIQGN
ncbi:MAG: HAMP domain-containing protein [Spirochaetaceae bacterium]|jgi:adenylate cyclase|nr:HAMP domain-containing protein [Spirochaetaceae bacterium]